MLSKKHILKFEEVGIKDVGIVGGKNASLGEMIRTLGAKGVPVPSGFIVTAPAYFYFLEKTGLDVFIKRTLKGLDTKNLSQLHRVGSAIRAAIMRTEFPKDLTLEIVRGYRELERRYGKDADVAVRSSATAEDLPGASFAGEQESYLGIRGPEEVLKAVRATMASLFTDRAISYRQDRGFDHFKIGLSAGVQKMVRSDQACSGVMFSLDTESGFRNVVLINGSWGLGEMIVKGEVTPDEFLIWKEGLAQKVKHPIIDKKLGVKLKKMVYHHGTAIEQTKIIPTSDAERTGFVLTDKEVAQLAHWAVIIEKHYTDHYKKWTPMDMEWAKDGVSGQIYIVQARPETIHAGRDYSKVKEYRLSNKGGETPFLAGAAVGSKIANGKARVILDAKHIGEFKKGEVLVTTMTDPDWEPIMKIASAIVTDKGGRTSHAAIVSRELGIPAVVGTEKATKTIKTGDLITVDTTGSAGSIYKGLLKFAVVEHDLKKIPKPKTKVMVNVAIPDSAFETSFLPNSGVGLAREEFIIASKMGLHPMALLDLKHQTPAVRRAIEAKMSGWRDPKQYYVDNLAFGIAKIGAAFFPNHVIVRFSDFKTNEYRTLLGGETYEPREENPMIGWRGASRYYDPKFRPAFMLEVAAIKKVREEMGLANVIPMVPFCRTVDEGMKVQEAMAEAGLITSYIASKKILLKKLGTRNQKRETRTPIYVMCEIPSNVLLADEFLKIFDGMSIGSNDLTQLTLGLDRDSGIVTHIANENNEAVKKLIAEVIAKCRKQKKYIGICGQAPSDYPDFAQFLVGCGIESISLNPDTVVRTTVAIAKKERAIKK